MAQSKLDAVDGGGSDKNALVPLTPMQHDPYKAKGSDFPVGSVNAATGQSGAHGTAEGKDKLATLSEYQESPRCLEDDGMGSGSGTPTGWNSGGRSAKIASNFPIKTNDESRGPKVSISERVNLQTGMIEVEGYSQTRVKETPEKKVSIPGR